jgi:opacity protein-like surface antigen
MKCLMQVGLLTVLGVAVLVPCASATEAELRDGSALLTGLAGYTSHQSQQSGDQIGGGSWSLSYARVGRSGEWSGGFVLRGLSSDENFQRSDGREVQINVVRAIAAVQGRWFPTTGRLTTYIGALAGVHLQTGEKFEEGVENFKDSNQNFAMGFSAGAMFHVTNGMFLLADYTFYYVPSSDTIQNNHINGIYGGLGFQFGGL